MIRLRGPLAYVWGVWHVAWLFGLFWAATMTDGDGLKLYFRVLYTVFLPPEIIGSVLLLRAKGVARETAYTLSQCRQWFGLLGGPDRPKVVGYQAVAAFTGIVDGTIVWYITSDVHPAIGAVLGTIICLWLFPHYGWRKRVG